MPIPEYQLAARPVHRKRKLTAAGPPPVGAPVLLAAVYDADAGPLLTLSFDRPIDISAIVMSSILMDDGEVYFFRYTGSTVDPARLTDPVTVAIPLTGFDEETTPGEHLTVSAGNGIVALGGVEEWAGCDALELPFP